MINKFDSILDNTPKETVGKDLNKLLTAAHFELANKICAGNVPPHLNFALYAYLKKKVIDKIGNPIDDFFE